MSKSHVVYPGDMAGEIEQAADDRNLSVSAFYTLAAEQLIEGEE